MSFHLIIMVILLAFLIAIVLEGYSGFRSLERLENVSLTTCDQAPSVSIIIPALDEEENIEEALGSVLAMDYDNLEVILINDRSTDNTGKIMERLAKDNPKVRVVHIKSLPPEWLGKNHALALGASKASGELLLFTDGDVVMEKTTLKRAVNYFQQNKLDHLAMFFDPIVPGGLLNMLVIDFGLSFLSFMKPWKAKSSMSRFYVGIGAFNLVRKKVYEAIGTHKSLSLHPVDDVELGRRIKRGGFVQDCLVGSGYISVKWYGSVAEMAQGLEKNIFPFLSFSIFKTILLSVFLFLIRIWPMAAVIIYDRHIQLGYVLMILIVVIMVLVAVKQNQTVPYRSVFFALLSPFIILYIIWRAVLLTILRGGVVWRSTFYPLDKLKKALKN